MVLDQEERSSRLIGAAIQVHRTIGPGFLEAIYENALAIELSRREIPFVRQVNVPIYYENVEVGRHVIDLFIEDQLVVELKTVKRLEEIHFVVLKSYLKATRKEVGLLLNFAQATLEIKRVVAHPANRDCVFSDSGLPGFAR